MTLPQLLSYICPDPGVTKSVKTIEWVNEQKDEFAKKNPQGKIVLLNKLYDLWGATLGDMIDSRLAKLRKEAGLAALVSSSESDSD
jgi:hypothetical protein